MKVAGCIAEVDRDYRDTPLREATGFAAAILLYSRPYQSHAESGSTVDIEAILEMITPEVHERLKSAVELGRWEDGSVLAREQRELCLQAIIVYEARNLATEERTGHIERNADTCADEPEVIRIVRGERG